MAAFKKILEGLIKQDCKKYSNFSGDFRILEKTWKRNGAIVWRVIGVKMGGGGRKVHTVAVLSSAGSVPEKRNELKRLTMWGNKIGNKVRG